jgi:very-short-patch-repair endonuclease
VTQQARQLRTTMTTAERRLWSVLRGRRLESFKFRRQYPFERYVLDFACVAKRLAVEADGGQHADNLSDEIRTAVLDRHGWRVLRLWNSDILANIEGVTHAILTALSEPGSPSPASGRGRGPPPQAVGG